MLLAFPVIPKIKDKQKNSHSTNGQQVIGKGNGFIKPFDQGVRHYNNDQNCRYYETGKLKFFHTSVHSFCGSFSKTLLAESA